MKPDEREKLIDAWAAECKELLNAPSLPVQLDPMVAIAIISQIQLASRHPENNGWMRTQAVEAARALQTLFSPTSVTARVLELGWDVDEDITLQRSDRYLDLWKFNGRIKPKFWFGQSVEFSDRVAVILGMQWVDRASGYGWWYFLFTEQQFCRVHESNLGAIVMPAEEFSPEQLAGLTAYHHEVMEIVRSALMDDDF